MQTVVLEFSSNLPTANFESLAWLPAVQTFGDTKSVGAVNRGC